MHWQFKYDIKQFLKGAPDEPTPEQVKDVAKKVCDELRGKDGMVGDYANDILDRLLKAEDKEEFNEVLDELYDYADLHRIWLGL